MRSNGFARPLRIILVFLLPIAFFIFVVFIGIFLQIIFFSQQKSSSQADVAIVLGAAAWGNHPSPVFRERINEAVFLYKSQRVKKLIFTGGAKVADSASEAKVAQIYAIQQGVDTEDILMDVISHSTMENLFEAKKLMISNGFTSALIVSDPLHMKRAMMLANELELDAKPSPVETSKFQSLLVQAKFIVYETWAILVHDLEKTSRIFK